MTVDSESKPPTPPDPVRADGARAALAGPVLHHPDVLHGRLALESGTLETGFQFTWEWSNFSDAISRYDEQFIRSFIYAGAATLIALVIAYPLAYAIAFRGGRWKNALLFAVVAPFFTTYLIRTIAWTTILSDDGVVVDVLKVVGIVGDDGRVLATPAAVIAGITYNFLPFMVLPIYAPASNGSTHA